MSKKTYPYMLYTWNPHDGRFGSPSRRMRLKVKPSLLIAAYLGGGEGWDEKGTPSHSLLCLTLQGSTRSQTARDYERYFVEYRWDELAREFSGAVDKIAGLDRAIWRLTLPCAGLTEGEIDEKIKAVLLWHEAEVTACQFPGQRYQRSVRD